MTMPIAQTSSEQKYEVTPLELFFDLVFAFAISQLSHHLLTELTWRGTAEVLVMLFAIFGTWLTTSWSATVFRADQSRTRWLIFVVMLLSLFMNASITRAFTSSGWAFVVPLLLIQLGRAIWMLTNSTDAVFRDHYLRVLTWLVITTPLWIVGAIVNPESRLLWWALAAMIDQIGRWLAHPVPGRRLRSENIPFDAEHFLERCRLFLIIALGETVFTTGSAIVASPTTLITMITGTFALVATIALWALNFEHSARLNIHYKEEASDPIRVARYAGNALIVMVAGLIGIAVANEMVITHPYGASSVTLNLLLFGCPILYLIAQGWYLRTVPRNSPRLRLIGSIALLVAGIATSTSPAYLALILVGASLTMLAVLDQRMTR